MPTPDPITLHETSCRVCGEPLQDCPQAPDHAYVCASHLDEPEPPTGGFREAAKERIRRLVQLRQNLGAKTISTRARKV